MKTPWHLWVVGVVTLLWNSMGALDYTMTQTQNEMYMGAFTPEQLAYFYSFPAWSVACWAIGVWFSVLGSILLLLRSRLALWSFILSFFGMIGTLVFTYGISDVSMVELTGPGAMLFSAVIFLVVVLLIWYSRQMKMAGVLR